MAQNSPLDVQCVDDFYFSALFNEDQGDIVPISDDKYAEELQFQETLMASVITSQKTTNESSLSPSVLCLPSSSSSSKALEVSLFPKTEQTEFTNEAGEPSLLEFKKEEAEEPSLIEFMKEEAKEPSLIEFMEEEAGESSQIICEICAETKGSHQMFRNQRCDHSFCSECVTKQVATKIQENITVVACPGLNCKGVLELDACRPMLPKDLLDRWDEALCEALFLAAPKFYCPFRDCSAMLLNDNEGEEGIINESECPVCHRLFCARCYVPWHPGVACEEFQRLNEDERGREDLLFRELANEKKWNRCPQCKFFVEKKEGCLHITCRCNFEFCYACGERWTSTHGGCQ